MIYSMFREVNIHQNKLVNMIYGMFRELNIHQNKWVNMIYSMLSSGNQAFTRISE